MSVKQSNFEGYPAQTPPKDTVSRYQQLKSMNLEVLGERLRRARIEKKISQRGLSAGLFTSAYLSSLELGKTRPTLTTLEQLAGLLGKSIEYFLRPTSGQNLDDALDEEQSRALELRQALLSAQVYLEHAADEQVARTLEMVNSGLSRLGHSDRGRYHYLMGRYYHRLGNNPQALTSLQQAQQVLAQSQDEPGFNYANVEPELPALIEYEMGAINAATRQTMAALNHFTSGLEALRPDSNPSLRWKLLAGTASCYRLLNDSAQAQTYFHRALDQAAENTSNKQADYFYRRASALSEQGDFQRSSLYYGRSMQVYDGAAEHEILQKVCLSLAQLQLQAKEYEAARQVAELALKLTSESDPASKGPGQPDHGQELSALVLLATIHHRQGDLGGASNYLEQVSRLQQSGMADLAGGSKEEMVLLGQYYEVAAELKADQGEREAAEGYYQQALETLEKLTGGDDVIEARLLADVYYSYGRRLKDWNDTERSLELMEKAYRLSTGKGRSNS